MAKKRGWWSQIQSGDYQETKTYYGSSSAANWRPEHDSPTVKTDERPTGTDDTPIRKKPLAIPKKKNLPLPIPSNGVRPLSVKKPLLVQKCQPKISGKPTTGETISHKFLALTNEEKDLLNKHINFYEALNHEHRKPETLEQKHFVEVCQERAKPRTAHEKAYIKYLSNLTNGFMNWISAY